MYFLQQELRLSQSEYSHFLLYLFLRYSTFNEVRTFPLRLIYMTDIFIIPYSVSYNKTELIAIL